MRRGTKMFKALKLARDFWKLACIKDGIPVDSMFAIFSKDNGYIKLRERALTIMYNNM